MRRTRKHIVLSSRPSTEHNAPEKAIKRIEETLYKPHLDFWNKKLATVILKNLQYHGRGNSDPLVRQTGIFYANEPWFIPVFGRSEAYEFDIVPLHPEATDLEEDLIKITANLGELDVEIYEVRRFLAGLFMFAAPLEEFENLFGHSLFNKISEPLRHMTQDYRNRVWNDGMKKSFKTYTEEHDYLITAMCQRIMMNLLTAGAFKQAERS